MRIRPLVLARFLWAPVLAVVATACGGPATQAAAPAGDDLLRVGSYRADVDDLREAVTAIHGEEASLAQLSVEQLRAAADALIAARLLVLEAERRGLDADPQIRATLDSARAVWAREALYERDVYGPLPAPSEQEIRALYQEWGQGEQVRGAHILLRTREEAEAVLRRLEAGADFDELARELSVHAMSSGVGGLMGWMRREQYPPAIAELIWELPAGSYADEPARTSMGWHVVASTARRTLSLDQQRAALENEWSRRQRQAARERFVEQLRARYKVVYHPETAAAVAALRDTLSGERRLYSWEGGRLDLAGFLERVQVPDPVSQDTARMHRLARELVFDELATLEAQRRGIPSLPDVQKRWRDKRFQLLSQALFEAVNTPPATAAQVRAFFDAHRDRFRSHRVVTAREILVDHEATADSLYRLIREGADMAELARRHTVRTDLALTGGLWEDVRPKDPRSARIYEAALRAGPGLHPPLKIPGGWSVFEVLDIRPGRRLDFDEAAEGARRSLAGQRMEELIEGLRREYADEIHVDEAALARLADGAVR